jgi:threonine aldolase
MLMRTVDLRSDTITRPTESMKRAMAEAEVGDDVFGEDPTVRRLEEMAAERTGKEAALYVASGTMANLVSQLTHCGRGNEMILGDQCHVFYYEQGGSAAMGGIHPRTVRNQPDGTIDLADIEAAIRPEDVHFPRTRLIVLENTHNRCHGTPIAPRYMMDVARLAHERGIRVHVDGARIFNAAAALGVDASELAGPADSVSFCLSKGLAAPVGSLVCGDKAFIEDARRARKVVGGGMRQAGVLAAAGIVALTEMVDRLADDHENAKRLATELAEIPGLSVDVDRVRTNIVYVDILEPGPAAPELVERLRLEGVRVLPVGSGRFRAVTHYHIASEDVAYALGVFRRVMRN